MVDRSETSDAGMPQLWVVETIYILAVLQNCGGNKTRAAEVLGIDRRTMYRKMETLLRRAKELGVPIEKQEQVAAFFAREFPWQSGA